MLDEVVEHDPLGKSDHVMLAWKFHYRNVGFNPCDADRECQKYNFKRGKYGHMSEELERVDWSVLDEINVEERWDFILKVLQRSIKHFVPRWRARKALCQSVPWWSRKLKRSVKLKYEAWKKYLLKKQSTSLLQVVRNPEKQNNVGDTYGQASV